MQSSLSRAPYFGSAQTDQQTYSNDEAVQISGQALDQVTGRVVVIGPEPLLEAGLAAGARSLILYGNPATTYALEYTTDLAAPAVWTRLPDAIAVTGLAMPVNGLDPAPDRIFYRAAELVLASSGMNIRPKFRVVA